MPNEGEPKTQIVRDLIARLTALFPDAYFGWNDDFEDGVFYMEMTRGSDTYNVTYLLEYSAKRGFGTDYYVDTGETNLTSYRCVYFESFSAAFDDLLTLTKTVLPAIE